MDQKFVILTTLRRCVRCLQALEQAHCQEGPRPIRDFPCLMPVIDEMRDVIRLVARRPSLIPRRR